MSIGREYTSLFSLITQDEFSFLYTDRLFLSLYIAMKDLMLEGLRTFIIFIVFYSLYFQDASHFGSASLSMLASQCSKVADPSMVYGHQDAMKNPYMSAWGMPTG